MDWKEKRRIPEEELQERIISIRELAHSEHELYELVKDRLDGQHYVHYAYVHQALMQDGDKEYFHQLLPIDTDDVLAILFEGKSYTYPEAWSSPYLRNGPLGYYVWFDPEGEENEELLGRAMLDRLEQFKREGATDEAAIRKLFDDIDELEK